MGKMIKTTFFTAFGELLNYFLAAFNIRSLKQDLQEAFSYNRVIHELASTLTRFLSRIELQVLRNNRLSKPGCSVHTTPEKFENAALLLRLGLPSTLIRHQNGTFRKRSSSQGNLKKPAFQFSCERKKHFENGAFRKRCRHVISLTEASSNTNTK